MTQLESARKNIPTALMRKLAGLERIDLGLLITRIAEGKIVIPANAKRNIRKPCAIGFSLSTKVNANIGTSTDKSKKDIELKKLDVALKYGADTVMDLSVGGNLKSIRREILDNSLLPVGTVPIYEIAVNTKKKKGDYLKFDAEYCLDILEAQAEEGVDFFTIHSGITRKSLEALDKNSRILGIVSRGGAILASWMRYHKKENPFYEHFDRVLDIARRHDVTLSLGDALRPGSVLDATDIAQITELAILGELALKARRKGVQVIIEGPGHVPLDQIQKNVTLEKRLCHNAPFYVLGPLVTDIASGYDHISSAIGGALAAGFGADFLCFVTASEHLRHPSIEDVREGVIASRIAAHAADIVKKVPGAIEKDRAMSLARRKRDWRAQIKLSIDPDKAKAYRLSSKPEIEDVCTMCSEYCSIKMMERCGKN